MKPIGKKTVASQKLDAKIAARIAGGERLKNIAADMGVSTSAICHRMRRRRKPRGHWPKGKSRNLPDPLAIPLRVVMTYVRDAIRSRKISIAKLATDPRLNVTRRVLARWIKCERCPPPDKLEFLSRFGGCGLTRDPIPSVTLGREDWWHRRPPQRDDIETDAYCRAPIDTRMRDALLMAGVESSEDDPDICLACWHPLTAHENGECPSGYRSPLAIEE